MDFYMRVIGKAIGIGVLNKGDYILVVGGGETDKNAFLSHNFKNVIISNLAHDRGVDDYSPYKWEYQDVEQLTCENNTFDWVFVHAALHHCGSPHHALCEMLRVARKGVGVFESRDSLLNRVSVKLGLVPNYELEPLVLTNGKSGGLRNSHIPNFVYRWTEHEVEKTVNSFLPQHIHEFYYYYDYAIPVQRLSMSPSFIKRMIGRVASIIVPFIRFLFPKQGNQFAFLVTKSGKLQPWLMEHDGEGYRFNNDYSKGRYNPEKYKRV